MLDEGLAGRMQALAGLRNLLVHAYAEIDDARVHAALDNGIEDLSEFAHAVAALVDDG